ncbi:MAG: VWA domain-containing protein, partial [Opitutales bacterium]
MIFRFAHPEAFLLLLLPLVFLFLRGRGGRQAAVQFPAIALAKQVAAFVRSKPGRFRGLLRAAVLTLLVVALARPQAGEETSEIRSSGVDIVLAVDLSTSMWAHDFELGGIRQDRLSVVKNVVREFIEARPNDRIGLVAFAAEPYLVSPLTLKHDWLIQRLEELRIGMVPDGTAIGSAIGSSVNRLLDQEAETRLVVLMTDGFNNRGQIDPLPAAEAAAAFDIKVYTIGVGRPGLVPYPADFDRLGRPVRTPDGRLPLVNRPSQIDLETLQQVAQETAARYYHATDAEELGRIYDEIDQLEKTEITFNVRRMFDDYFWIPLLGALGLLL